MSMMDLAGALGGGGAPPGAGPGGPGPGGPPPTMEVPADQGAPPDPGGGGSTIDFLDTAEDALHSFIQEDPDEVDRAEAAKALQIILKLKASNQQSAQNGDMKSLRRALSGPGAAPVG